MGLLNDLIADEARFAQDVARLNSLLNGLGGSTFETPEDAAAVDLLPWEQVTILRPDIDSPIAAAIYERVGAEPSHPEWFQDTAGRYYAVRLENGYVRTAWFGIGIASVRRAQVLSKRIIFTTGENYEIPATGDSIITATDEDIDIAAGQSTFTLIQSSVAMLTSIGTYADEQLVSAIAGNVFTVPDATKYVKGDILKMGDSITPPWWVQRTCRQGIFGFYRAGEHGAVGAASGTTLTMAGDPLWSTDRIPATPASIMAIDISGAANNGSGAIRITTSHPHFYTTGLNILVGTVGGVPNANGTWQITVIDSTHFDLIGSTFAGTYTSGGTCRMTCTYSTHASAAFKVGRVRDGLCRIRIGKILCGSTVTSHSRVFKVSSRKAIDWKATYIQRSAALIFSPVSCFGGNIEYYIDGTGPGNANYATTVAGGDNLNIIVNGSGTVRHAIDGGLASTDDGVTGLAACGPASFINVTIEGGNIGSTESPHATHDGTAYWSWNFPKARQTTSVIACRGIGHTVYNGRSSRGGSFGCFSQFYVGVSGSANNGSGAIRLSIDDRGGRGPDLATGMKVRVRGATGAAATSTNGDFYITVIADDAIDLIGSTFSSSSGAENAICDAMLDAADEFRVVGATMDDNSGQMVSGQTNGGAVEIIGGSYTGAGSPSGVIFAGRSLKIRNLNVYFKGSPATRIIGVGVHTERVDIKGLVIDADGTLPNLFDLNNIVTLIPVRMHDIEIDNPNGAVASLFRSLANSTPAAGSRFGNIRVSGICTTLISGLSLAASITALADFCDGPIVINGEKVLDAPDA